jgi:hypothetical protein
MIVFVRLRSFRSPPSRSFNSSVDGDLFSFRDRIDAAVFYLKKNVGRAVEAYSTALLSKKKLPYP